MSAIRIGIIIGSTRPGRNGAQVAEWVRATAAAHAPHVEFELIDLIDHPLPHFDEPVSPARQSSQHEQALAWSATIDGFDGFVFVTPEYNHSISGVLKNAIDYLYAEWNDKAAGFVGYGSAGGARAVEHLRLVMAEVQVATVRNQVALSLFTDFENYTTFKPDPRHEKSVSQMLDQLVAWGGAMKTLRGGAGPK